jgi:hypothetical protein
MDDSTSRPADIDASTTSAGAPTEQAPVSSSHQAADPGASGPAASHDGAGTAEGDAASRPPAKKRRRGSRGGKGRKRPASAGAASAGADDDLDDEADETDDLADTVADDGSGFDLAANETRDGHFGIRGMRERARRLGAVLSIATAPGAGTRVSIELEPATDATRPRGRGRSAEVPMSTLGNVVMIGEIRSTAAFEPP